jgi:hypothetical protein
MSIEHERGCLHVFVSRRASPEAFSSFSANGHLEGWDIRVTDTDTHRRETIAAGVRVVPCACLREVRLAGSHGSALGVADRLGAPVAWRRGGRW